MELARLMAYFLNARERLDREIPYLVAVGLLLYLLSVALHYVLLAVEESRQARSRLATRNCGR